jgi:xylulokinase
VIVAVGGGDNMMGAIGTGAVAPGRLTISLGTSGTLYGFADKPAIAQNNEFAAFCGSSGGYLPLVCTLNCTAATELVRELLAIPISDFDAQLRQIAPGSDGVIALPFFNGERTPNCPNAKASFWGLSPATMTRAHLLRAVTEATVLGLRSGLEAIQKNGLVTRTACVIGGGSHSQEWLQIVADVLNVEVTVAVHDEAAAFGAALQAYWCYRHGQGSTQAISDLVDDHTENSKQAAIRPRTEAVTMYNEVFREYKDLVVTLAQHYS